LDFLNTKPKIASKATKGRKLKKQIRRNNRNIFGLFVFWKAEIKAISNKVKKAKHGYTKDR
jgi:hypothetical protein